VKVVGHQAIVVDLEVEALAVALQQGEELAEVLGIREEDAAIVSTGHDVVRGIAGQ
jgi:hypothetical protein